MLSLFRRFRTKLSLAFQERFHIVAFLNLRSRILQITFLDKYYREKEKSSSRIAVPPKKLIHLVAGTDDILWFLKKGRQGIEDITNVLRKNHLNIAQFDAILDFGCGCGRVMRHFKFPNKIFGTDYNQELIDWNKKNIPFGEFETNLSYPPLKYKNSQFDFIYSFSVFTHLVESQQAEWMKELSRVLKPGGYLLISVHGEYFYQTFNLNPGDMEKIKNGQLVVTGGKPGSNQCCAAHPEKYVRDQLSKGFEIIDFIPKGATTCAYQDIYLLRKPFKP